MRKPFDFVEDISIIDILVKPQKLFANHFDLQQNSAYELIYKIRKPHQNDHQNKK